MGVVAEAVAEANQREIVMALIGASPLTDLLEPTRLEPRLDLKPIVKWLKEPRVARMVADRYLSMGLEQVGPVLAAALVDLYNQKDARVESRLATRFLCHLQLLWLLGDLAATEATRRSRVFTMAAHKEGIQRFLRPLRGGAAHRSRPSVRRGPRSKADRDRRWARRARHFAVWNLANPGAGRADVTRSGRARARFVVHYRMRDE